VSYLLLLHLQFAALTILNPHEEPQYEDLVRRYNNQRMRGGLTNIRLAEGTALLSSLLVDALSRALYDDRRFSERLDRAFHTRQQIDSYPFSRFQNDLKRYLAHVESMYATYHLLGVQTDPKDPDPALADIYVSLRLAVDDANRFGLIAPAQHSRVSGADDPTWTVGEILRSTSYAVLLGGPGSGKSFTTRHLAWTHAAAHCRPLKTTASALLLPGRPVPLRIELRAFAAAQQSRPSLDVLTFAQDDYAEINSRRLDPRFFVTLLEQGRVLLLFDGLDEVPDISIRSRIIQTIITLVRTFPKNQVLVTSRPRGYDLAPLPALQFARTELRELDNEQIQEFLARWYRYVTHELILSPVTEREVNILHSTLIGRSQLRDLARNPLLLTVLAAVHRRQRLPEERADAYRACAELLLHTWVDIKRGRRDRGTVTLSDRVQLLSLAYLGYALHSREQATLDPEDTAGNVAQSVIHRTITEYLEREGLLSRIAADREAEALLSLVRDEAGLLVLAGQGRRGDDRLKFVHRTFQEYFAASHLAEDQETLPNFLRDNIHDPHWREVVLLLFGQLNPTPATTHLRTILSGTSYRSGGLNLQSLTQHDLLFVCDCLAEGVQVQVRFAEDAITQLISLCLDSSIESRQETAVNILKRLAALPSQRQKIMALLQEIIEGLAFPPQVRLAAILTLVEIALSEVPEVLKALAACRREADES